MYCGVEVNIIELFVKGKGVLILVEFIHMSKFNPGTVEKCLLRYRCAIKSLIFLLRALKCPKR